MEWYGIYVDGVLITSANHPGLVNNSSSADGSGGWSSSSYNGDKVIDSSTSSRARGYLSWMKYTPDTPIPITSSVEVRVFSCDEAHLVYNTSGAIIKPDGQANFTGICTAASFVGNVTGDVTGDVTGNVSGTAGGLTGVPSITVYNATVNGSLTVNGTTTTLNTATLDVEDLNITVAKGAGSAAAADGAGLTVDGASATLLYASTGDKWVANKDIEAPNFNATSDITLKENVSIIDNALDMINSLDGISWNWKDSGKASLGVSAQNVETVAPELVSNGSSHKAVNYNGLIGILIEAVKEQSNQISELRVELAKKANSRRKRK